jgi:hypothetical protein
VFDEVKAPLVQVLNIGDVSRQEIIHGDDLMALLQKILTKM